MKSRLARASTTRPSPPRRGARLRPGANEHGGGQRSPADGGHAQRAAAAPRRRAGSSRRPCTRTPPRGRHCRPRSRARAPRGDSRNLSRASSPSQPSRIEWVRKRSAPTSCQAGRRTGRTERRCSPTARLTRVIALGVIDVHASRRVTAREIRRSKWRDMKPSLSFIEALQEPGLGFGRVVGSGQRRIGRSRSNEVERRRSRSPRAAIRSSAVVARAAVGERPPPGSSVSTRATIDGSTESVSGSTDDSARARSQRAWTMTLVGQTMMRRRPGDPASPSAPSSTAMPSAHSDASPRPRAEDAEESGATSRERDAPEQRQARDRCVRGRPLAPRRDDQEQPAARRRRRGSATRFRRPRRRVADRRRWPRRQGSVVAAPPARLAREALDHDAERWPRRGWSPSAPRRRRRRRKGVGDGAEPVGMKGAIGQRRARPSLLGARAAVRTSVSSEARCARPRPRSGPSCAARPRPR